MVLVHMGSPAEGEHFFDERWPEARAVSDPEKHLYAAFGLTRGSLTQVMGPRAAWAGLRSILGGHGAGRPVGDPLMLSGWFLVEGDRVIFEDVHEHAGAARQVDALRRVWGQQ